MKATTSLIPIGLLLGCLVNGHAAEQPVAPAELEAEIHAQGQQALTELQHQQRVQWGRLGSAALAAELARQGTLIACSANADCTTAALPRGAAAKKS